jgi:hypothetical protein
VHCRLALLAGRPGLLIDGGGRILYEHILSSHPDKIAECTCLRWPGGRHNYETRDSKSAAEQAHLILPMIFAAI